MSTGMGNGAAGNGAAGNGVNQETMRVTAADGRSYDATVVLPESGSGPGIVLYQEIFGVNDFLLGKAADLAKLGYAVCCPDVFWRIEPGVSLPHDEIGLQRGMSLVGRWMGEVPDDTKVSDLLAGLSQFEADERVTGGVAVMGYCLGGTLAYMTAIAGEPAACVSYYGSGVADQLGAAGEIKCPVLFHFGDHDSYIPNDQVDRIKAAFADRQDVTVRVAHGAGHAFENLLAPAFANPAAAAESWPVTVGFLEQHLPVR